MHAEVHMTAVDTLRLDGVICACQPLTFRRSPAPSDTLRTHNVTVEDAGMVKTAPQLKALQVHLGGLRGTLEQIEQAHANTASLQIETVAAPLAFDIGVEVSGGPTSKTFVEHGCCSRLYRSK